MTSNPLGNLEAGKDPTAGMLDMQKELLGAYEQTSRAWLDRVRSEMELWSELAAKVSAARSAQEASDAYQQWMARRMQMATEDGRRLYEESQKMMQRIGQSLGNSWPSGSRST